MCIQPVLSATDLLHVPLKLLDQNLQFTDALVSFVSCTAQRPGLNKDQVNTDLNLLEMSQQVLKVDSTAKITISQATCKTAVDLKAKQMMIFTSLVI